MNAPEGTCDGRSSVTLKVVGACTLYSVKPTVTDVIDERVSPWFGAKVIVSTFDKPSGSEIWMLNVFVEVFSER